MKSSFKAEFKSEVGETMKKKSMVVVCIVVIAVVLFGLSMGVATLK